MEIHRFVHCRTCVERGQTERLETGLTGSGIQVQCKKHGLVGHFTPEELGSLLSDMPECDCCRERGGPPEIGQ